MNKEQITELHEEKKQLLDKLAEFKNKKTESSDKKETRKLTQFAKSVDISQPQSEIQTLNTDTRTVADILALNDKLIGTLEQADGQLQALSQLNTKYMADLQEKDATIKQYQQTERATKDAQFNDKLNLVTHQWCEVFSITDGTKQAEARKMLSTFQSEDKLAEVEKMLVDKMSVMSNQPQQITQPSHQIVQAIPETTQVKKSVHDMTPKERKTYIDELHRTYMQ